MNPIENDLPDYLPDLEKKPPSAYELRELRELYIKEKWYVWEGEKIKK